MPSIVLLPLVLAFLISSKSEDAEPLLTLSFHPLSPTVSVYGLVYGSVTLLLLIGYRSLPYLLRRWDATITIQQSLAAAVFCIGHVLNVAAFVLLIPKLVLHSPEVWFLVTSLCLIRI